MREHVKEMNYQGHWICLMTALLTSWPPPWCLSPTPMGIKRSFEAHAFSRSLETVGKACLWGSICARSLLQLTMVLMMGRGTELGTWALALPPGMSRGSRSPLRRNRCLFTKVRQGDWPCGFWLAVGSSTMPQGCILWSCSIVILFCFVFILKYSYSPAVICRKI